MNDNFIEQLQNYKDRINKWEKFRENKEGTRFNKEHNTTIKFVIPLFNILGWNHISEGKEEDMEFEYYIKGKGRVDIALYLPENRLEVPKILIEVKPVQDELKKASFQMFKHYLINSRIKYGIVTNGREVVLLDKFKKQHKSKKFDPLFSIKMDDFIDYNDVLWVLSKEMVKEEMLDKLAAAYHTKQYWEWREKEKNGSLIDNYKLRLKFARNFLNNTR